MPGRCRAHRPLAVRTIRRYAACAEDLFCATDGGNVFSCAAQCNDHNSSTPRRPGGTLKLLARNISWLAVVSLTAESQATVARVAASGSLARADLQSYHRPRALSIADEPCDNEAILKEQIANLTAELNTTDGVGVIAVDDDDDAGLVVGLVIAAAVAVLGLGLVAVLIAREKDGKALFAPLENTESSFEYEHSKNAFGMQPTSTNNP